MEGPELFATLETVSKITWQKCLLEAILDTFGISEDCYSVEPVHDLEGNFQKAFTVEIQAKMTEEQIQEFIASFELVSVSVVEQTDDMVLISVNGSQV